MIEPYIKELIERSGEMWEASADRTTLPVLITRYPNEGALTYALTLPPGEPHPFWRIEKIRLSVEDAAELDIWRKETDIWDVGALLTCDPDAEVFETKQVNAFIKNGRRPAWNVSLNRVRITMERERVDPVSDDERV